MRTRANKFPGAVGWTWLIVMAVLFSSPAWAEEGGKQQGTVDESLATFQRFIANKQRFRDYVKDAKAFLIVPSLLKAGFFLGGAAGSGILVAWDENREEWSQPAFYRTRSLTFGLQAGGEVAEIIVMIRSRNALEALSKNMFKLGGDASVAVGPLGVGTQWNVSGDALSFAQCKGLFFGLNYDGAVVGVHDDWNKAYYGKAVSTMDIIAKNAVSNPGSARLREALKNAVK